MKHLTPEEGYVYILLCEAMGTVKIGFTKAAPSRRVAKLQTGLPVKLTLLGYFEATTAIEKAIHAAFAPIRLHGEWFKMTGKMFHFAHYFDNGGKLVDWSMFQASVHDNVVDATPFPGEEGEEFDCSAIAKHLAPYSI